MTSITSIVFTSIIINAPLSMACSSLSVFALHPLYLRVQALSENISEDIKVRSSFSRRCIVRKTFPFNLEFSVFFWLQKEIEQTRKDLDKKVLISF